MKGLEEQKYVLCHMQTFRETHQSEMNINFALQNGTPNPIYKEKAFVRGQRKECTRMTSTRQAHMARFVVFVRYGDSVKNSCQSLQAAGVALQKCPRSMGTKSLLVIVQVLRNGLARIADLLFAGQVFEFLRPT